MKIIAKPFIAIIIILLWVSGPALSNDIESIGVTIDRYKINDSVEYHFCSDLFGTGIISAGIISPPPLNQRYPLAYSNEEEQWYYDKTGPQAAIETEFPDGIYLFDVTYADMSTDSASATLGGTFPPFPEFVSFTSDRLTWQPWTSPVNPQSIEITISTEEGSSAGATLSPASTFYEIPDGFVNDNQPYTIDILFISNNSAHGHKNSGLRMTYSYSPVPVPTLNEWGMIALFTALSGLSVYFIKKAKP